MRQAYSTNFRSNLRLFIQGIVVFCIFISPVQANGYTQCEIATQGTTSVEKAIDTCRQELTQETNSLAKATILSTLGQLYSNQKETEIAIAAWQEAGQYLDLTETDSPESQLWAQLQVFIAQALFRSDSQNKAEDYFLKQLKFAKRQTGMFSLTVAKLQETLGSMYALEGKKEKAFTMFQESALIYQLKSGKLSLNAIENQMSYGIALLDLGMQVEALAFFEQFTELLNSSQGYKNSIIMAEALTFLGTLQMRSNQVLEAAKSFHGAYRRHTNHFGRDQLATTQVLNNFGVALFRSGYLDKAEEVLNQAYLERAEKLGPEDSLTQSSKNNLNAVLEAKQNGQVSKLYVNINTIN